MAIDVHKCDVKKLYVFFHLKRTTRQRIQTIEVTLIELSFRFERSARSACEIHRDRHKID